MVKKLLLIMLVMLSMMFSVYSADEYLTSCQSVTWNASNTYYINLSNPLITSGTYCFTGTMNGITIYQLNDKITIDSSVTGNYFFFNSGIYTNNNYHDLNIEYENDAGLKYYFGTGSNSMTGNRFYDSAFTGGDLIAYRSRTGGGSIEIFDNLFYNSSIAGLSRIFEGSADGFVNPRRIEYNDFHETFIWTDLHPFCMTGSGFSRYNDYFNVAGNYVTDVGSCVGAGSIPYTTSVLEGETDVDINDDGIGDGNVNKLMKLVFSVRGTEYTFLQDVAEGFDLGPYTNDNIVIINSDAVDFSTDPLLLGNNGNNVITSEFNTISATDPSAIDLGTYNIYSCGLFLDQTCYITANGFDIVANKFRGTIILRSHTTLDNLEVYKLTLNDWNLVSNNIDTTHTNITIINSDFKSQFANVGNTSTASENLIKLKANYITINNNVLNFNDTSGNGEYLYIEGTNSLSNKIYNNSFINDIGTPLANSTVFSYECDATVYNNYLDSNVVMSDSCISGLNISPLITYEHTDGKIYYFQIGNYYTDNSACVDGDSNGICDSSYTSGVITDTHPLASYPFDYVSHLLTADYVVDNTSFNINMVNITDNETVTLSDLTSTIRFVYNHDSDFPDLTCDLILDGGSIDTTTNVPKNTNITHDESRTWLEKNYTVRVECINEYSFEQSYEYTIIIEEDSIVLDGDGVDISGGIGLTNFYSSDPDETAESVISLFGLMEDPLGYGLIAGIVFFILALVSVFLSIMYFMLPK